MKRFWAYGMAWLLVLAGNVSASLLAPRVPEPVSIRAHSCGFVAHLPLLCHVDADATTTHYYHADEQGSTLAITDTGGNVTDQFAYTPWGELTARTGTTATPYQWLGGVAVRTEANGLCYMLNRYYSVAQKRFISPDPSGLGGGANLYAYANLNPAFYTDPFGLCAESFSTSLNRTLYGYDTFDDYLWQEHGVAGSRLTGTGIAGSYGGGSGGVLSRYTTEYNRYGAVAAGFLALGDLTGVNGVYEGITGRDVVSGESLSGGQRLLRGGLGAVQMASLGMASAEIGAGLGSVVGERLALRTMNAEIAANAARMPVAARSGTVVIGENMERVAQYALRIGAETFQGTGMDANRLWIQEVRSAGKQVIDIGPDFPRRLQRVKNGIRPDSPFYNMERMETTGYENYLKVFERTSKYQGGLP